MAEPDIADDIIQRLLNTEQADELYEVGLEAAVRVLDADSCQLVEVNGDDLAILASSNPDQIQAGTVPVATDIVGQLDLIGRSHVFDDINDVRSVSASQAIQSDDTLKPRSLLVVPIDSLGLLVAMDEAAGAFDEVDQSWAEELASFIDGVIRSTESQSSDGIDQDRLERIAKILSHDFAGPLTVARGSIELAEETGESKYFNRANKAIDQIEQLVDGIERLANSDDRYPRPEMIELRSIAEEVWPAVDHGDATLEIEGSRPILADEHALAQLLRNLFSNAVDHGGDDVTIQVGATDTGFFVEDDGPGIEPEDRELIFSWGYSSGDNRKGIGLSIVEQICAVHDWDITVTDSDLDGARFEITDAESSH